MILLNLSSVSIVLYFSRKDCVCVFRVVSHGLKHIHGYSSLFMSSSIWTRMNWGCVTLIIANVRRYTYIHTRRLNIARHLSNGEYYSIHAFISRYDVNARQESTNYMTVTFVKAYICCTSCEAHCSKACNSFTIFSMFFFPLRTRYRRVGRYSLLRYCFHCFMTWFIACGSQKGSKDM